VEINNDVGLQWTGGVEGEGGPTLYSTSRILQVAIMSRLKMFFSLEESTNGLPNYLIHSPVFPP